jgi:hypothetical protein
MSNQAMAPATALRRVLKTIRLLYGGDPRARVLIKVFARELALARCQSAFKFGSDSLLMKFKRRLALVSQRNQHDAASPTSVGPGPSRV